MVPGPCQQEADLIKGISPTPPSAKRFTHDESFVAVIEPRQFFGEHGDALAPRTRHFRELSEEKRCADERPDQ